VPCSVPREVIALDGPSGSGKSTVARAVARRLGWRYVDTGATYRAATLAALRAGADLDDPAAVTAVVSAARIELGTDPDAPRVRLDGEDVSAPIRGAAVTGAVSAVSAVPAVRRLLTSLQRTLAGDGGAVLEGRDVGTAVFPDATVKVYLDASPMVRAQRRAGDGDSGLAPGDGVSVRRVAEDLARRDGLDSTRATSPLSAAADAVHLDSSALSAGDVAEAVLALATQAGIGCSAP